MRHRTAISAYLTSTRPTENFSSQDADLGRVSALFMQDLGADVGGRADRGAGKYLSVGKVGC